MVDWSEIEALQNELEEVQKESTATRLSERNCVELIMKLKELNLIKVDFHNAYCANKISCFFIVALI